MLRAAILSSDTTKWHPKAKDDLIWASNKADILSDAKNDAIHAPASLYFEEDREGQSMMRPAFSHGHPRAKKFERKEAAEVMAAVITSKSPRR
jgi:hypothetical protein